MAKKTIVKTYCRDELLMEVDDCLVQVREGRDFFIGQKRYVVEDVDWEVPEEVLVIQVSDPDQRCPYKAHRQPCDCRGEGGDR